MKQIVVPEWITKLKVVEVENSEQVDLKDEPVLEEKFSNILSDLEGMKNETKCGTCRNTFQEMIQTGKNYQKVQALITKMDERGHHSWSEISESEKKELKQSVGI